MNPTLAAWAYFLLTVFAVAVAVHAYTAAQ